MAGLHAYLDSFGDDMIAHDALINATLAEEGGGDGARMSTLNILNNKGQRRTRGRHVGHLGRHALHNTLDAPCHTRPPFQLGSRCSTFRPATEGNLLSFGYDILWDRALSL